MLTPSRLLPALVFGLALASGAARAEEAAPAWSDDVAASLKKAEAENKDVLMDFTGSDWCVWCQKLKAEVFDTDAFKKAAPEHFVTVELDFPNNKPQSDAVKKQNRDLQKKFDIQGFPTIMLVDAKGRPFGQLGYAKGGPEAWLKLAEDLRARRVARDAKWAEAAKAEGAEKAKLIEAGLDALGNEDLVAAHYAAELDEAIKLDADGKAGIKAKYEAKRKRTEEAKATAKKIKAIMRSAGGKPEDAVAQLKALAAQADLSGESRQQAMATASQVCKFMLKDDARAEALFDEAIAAAPETELGRKLKEIKPNFFPKKEAVPETK